MWIERDQLKTLAVLGVLFTAFAAGIWYPTQKKRAELGDRIAAAEKELGIDPESSSRLAEWHADVVRLQRTVSGAQHSVPPTDELASVLRGLTRSLQAHGVVDQEVVTREKKTYLEYSVIPIFIEFRGSFAQTYGVLEEIENLPRLIRVDRFEAEGSIRDPQQPLRVTLELSTFCSEGEEAER